MRSPRVGPRDQITWWRERPVLDVLGSHSSSMTPQATTIPSNYDIHIDIVPMKQYYDIVVDMIILVMILLINMRKQCM